MTAIREQEPEINISTGGKKLTSTKRSLSKQNVDGTPSKKQRAASALNNKPVPRTEEITAKATSEKDRKSDVSYRHLFTFANTTEQEQSEPDKSTTPSFTFLNEDDETEKKENGKAATAFRFIHDDERPSPNEVEERHPLGNAEDDMQIDRPSDSTFSTEYTDRRRAGNRHMNVASSRKPTSQTAYRQRNERLETTKTPAADVLMIPEDIESRPDEILRIATRFCRQKSVEELEEDWCAPGGIRETMKRDFKQKRQNVTRGRKLGSSNKR